LRLIVKGEAPPGTIHHWRTGPHEKQADGSWKPVGEARREELVATRKAIASRVTETDRQPLTQRPPPVRIPDEVKGALDSGGWLVINSSGGKDSQTITYMLATHPELAAHKDRMVVLHADLGRGEWPGGGRHAEYVAEAMGLPFVDTRKATRVNPASSKLEPWVGDFLDHHIERAAWSAPGKESCRADLKRGPLWGWIKANIPPDVPIVNALGIRREEGEHDKTSKLSRWFADEVGPAAEAGKNREAYNWNPIVDYKLDDVWAAIRESGLDRHHAYDMGASRLSCFLCMLATDNDHQVAVKAHPELAKVWYEAEQKMRANHERRRDVLAQALDRAIAEGRLAEEVVERKQFGKVVERKQVWLLGMNSPELRAAGGIVGKKGVNAAKRLRGQARKAAKLGDSGKAAKLNAQAAELEARHREGDIRIPNRYMRPFLEFQQKRGKPWTVKDIILAAGLGEQLGITAEGEPREVESGEQLELFKAMGAAIVQWAQEHSRRVLSYGKLAHRSALLLEQAGAAAGAERERLLRLRGVVLDQVAAAGAELAGEHPFPTRHENIGPELALIVRRS
jgi:3'-phosphoadenosine 5'-phosphosulfate sulfotransferase (PAPS reductase)/FAD synthetase